MEVVNVGNEDTPDLKDKLAKNHPNPFNPETKINFSLAKNGNVSLEVYNIKGQLIKTLQNGYTDAGEHSVVWIGDDENGQKVTSGIYFYRLQTENMSKTRKMLLLK
jgi:flagellar hook assembly protein FlgD